MNKLIDANFMRLRKSKVLLVCAVFMAGLGVLMAFSNFKANGEGYEVELEGTLFAFTTFLGIVISCFVTLFTGTEYSDGTIRNKVIIGHSRTEIYLSCLISGSAAALALCAVYLIVYVCLSLPITGWFAGSFQEIFLRILCSLVLTLTFTAIFTMVTMLNQNKAVTAVLGLLLALVILFSGAYIKSSLNEPEYYDAYSYITDEGVVESGEKEKNPRYLSGTKREIYEFLDAFLPGGQQLQLSQGGNLSPWSYMGYSAVILVVTTAVGIMVFRKKDLR